MAIVPTAGRTIALNGPRMPPGAGGAARQLVILLHGYGADGADLINLADHWRSRLPHAAFVAPNAPERVPGAPMGYQWFPIGGYDPDDLRQGSPAAAARAAAMATGAAHARALLDRFIDAELAAVGLEERNLALVGFSQGTMLALETGPRRAQACAGIVGFSGALIGPERLEAEMTARPPIMLVHGDSDSVVPAEAMFDAAAGLSAAGGTVEWHLRPGLGHGIDPRGLALAGHFLGQCLLQA